MVDHVVTLDQALKVTRAKLNLAGREKDWVDVCIPLVAQTTPQLWKEQLYKTQSELILTIKEFN